MHIPRDAAPIAAIPATGTGSPVLGLDLAAADGLGVAVGFGVAVGRGVEVGLGEAVGRGDDVGRGAVYGVNTVEPSVSTFSPSRRFIINSLTPFEFLSFLPTNATDVLRTSSEV